MCHYVSSIWSESTCNRSVKSIEPFIVSKNNHLDKMVLWRDKVTNNNSLPYSYSLQVSTSGKGFQDSLRLYYSIYQLLNIWESFLNIPVGNCGFRRDLNSLDFEENEFPKMQIWTRKIPYYQCIILINLYLYFTLFNKLIFWILISRKVMKYSSWDYLK